MIKIHIYWSGKMFTDFPFPLANSQSFISSQHKHKEINKDTSFIRQFPTWIYFPPSLAGHIPLHYPVFILLTHHTLIISVTAWWCPSLGSSESRAWDKDLGAGSLFGRWSKDTGVSGEQWDTQGRKTNKGWLLSC